MALKSVRDAFDEVVKNQELVSSTYAEVIEHIDNGIKEAITKIQSVDQPSTDHVAVITNLKRKLETLWPHEQLEKSQKELNKNLTKYPKILSKFADPDISEAYRKVEFDSHTVNQIIITSLCHQGLLDIADVFITESQEPDINPLRSEIERFNKVILAFKAGNEVPAMTWISEYRETLAQNGSNLDFEICALHRLKLLRNLKRKRDFGIPDNHIVMMRSPHPQYLGWMGVFYCWMGVFYRWMGVIYRELKGSNTSHLVKEMTNQFFSIIGKNPLSVTIEAGAIGLPTLLKLARVMSLNKMQEWETMKKLPVPIDLGSKFQFHSVFVCPASGEVSDQPHMLPCHHVISLDTIIELSKYHTREFNCPVCESVREDQEVWALADAVIKKLFDINLKRLRYNLKISQVLECVVPLLRPGGIGKFVSMDLKGVKEAFNEVVKNQELVTSSYKEAIDQVENKIKEAIKKIQSVDHPSIEHNKSVIINLKQNLERIWPHDQRLKQSQKELNKSFTKYPKILSKFADPDISEAYRNVDFDSGTVNQVIITSLYHEGFDDVVDSFIQESQEPDIKSLEISI
ncbi:protein RMD5 [Tanacetum coccineum]|uniref:Protein RMD5 n=1 Tax=Tanacetum coccineum TaxID=301880 RepID=A0ABQ5EBD0_9ASTR